jgi:hypothetical protein
MFHLRAGEVVDIYGIGIAIVLESIGNDIALVIKLIDRHGRRSNLLRDVAYSI